MKNFERLGAMLDCSRNGVPKVETVKRFIRYLKRMGYDYLLLYMEDVYELENEPYFGCYRGRYTVQEMQEMDAFGNENGVEIIPCVQTLAHLGTIFKWEQYLPIHDCNGILLIDEEKTYTLIEKMFASLRQGFTTKNLHIGLDEAFMVGLGRYRTKHGIPDRFELLLKHLTKVNDLAKKYDFTCMTWSDMFIHLLDKQENGAVEKVYDIIPKDVALVFWDYYITNPDAFDEALAKHKTFSNEIYFAGGAICWTGFAPANEYSISASRVALQSCIKHGVKNACVCLWGDSGRECSAFSVLPAMYAFAQYADGNFDEESIKQGFEKEFSIAFDDFLMLDLPNKPSDKPALFNNPSKYFFYNDMFLGLMDCYAYEGIGKRYGEHAERLKPLCEHEEFGDLFQCMEALLRVLAVKTEMGVTTRRLYQAGDKKALGELAENEYGQLLCNVEKCYNAFKNVWLKDHKPFGFEVQDARIGGLLMRIRHCRERLWKYSKGEIDSIPELQEQIVGYLEGVKEIEGDQTQLCSWEKIITRGVT